jgi:hypothetical protein
MHRILAGLLLAALLILPGQVAYADDPDFCAGASARAALPTLQDSFNWAPSGYGPFGYGPVTHPFGIGPLGDATYFGPPGLVPSYGPLGPGLTANAIALGVLAPSGFSPTDPANAGTLTSLAALQQAELGTLNGRLGNSALYQTANATWAGARATQAGAVFAIYSAICANPLPMTAMPLTAPAVANGLPNGAPTTWGSYSAVPGMAAPWSPWGQPSPWGPQMMPGMTPAVANGMAR